MDITPFFNFELLIGLVTLVALEVVLGIDNVIFMAIQTDKLPKEQRELARKVGLAAAGLIRIGLLFAIGWLMKMKAVLFEIFSHPISGKDLIMVAGGTYLLWHSVKEIHIKVRGNHSTHHTAGAIGASFASVMFSVLALDIVFSIDSVMTAVGMLDNVAVMATAIVISVVVMLGFSGVVVSFIQRHPTVQILALSFLVLIGFLLIAEGFGQHVSKGYVYAAVLFATVVEFLQIRAERNEKQASEQ